MIVEQLEPGQLCEFSSDAKLSNSRRSVNEDEFQLEPKRSSLTEIALFCLQPEFFIELLNVSDCRIALRSLYVVHATRIHRVAGLSDLPWHNVLRQL